MGTIVSRPKRRPKTVRLTERVRRISATQLRKVLGVNIGSSSSMPPTFECGVAVGRACAKLPPGYRVVEVRITASRITLPAIPKALLRRWARSEPRATEREI